MRRSRGIEVALMLVLAPFAIAIVVTLLLFRAYWIPSGSMKPTLLIGDYLLVNRAAYGFPAMMCNLGQCDQNMGPFGELPARGDVVTFIHPVAGHHYVKRVIGLPGDSVQMLKGRLNLNGSAVATKPSGVFEEPYVLENGYIACNNAPVPEGGICRKAQAQETLPEGRSFMTINIADGMQADDTAVFTVPAGHVFVIGDNRDNSLDSRYPAGSHGMGFIPLENMIGRADVILFSLKGNKGRVLQWVQ